MYRKNSRESLLIEGVYAVYEKQIFLFPILAVRQFGRGFVLQGDRMPWKPVNGALVPEFKSECSLLAPRNTHAGACWLWYDQPQG